MTEIMVKGGGRSSLAIYKDLLLTPRPGLKSGDSIPRIEAASPNMSISAGRLAQYRKVCGFSLRDELPLTFTHILAFPLHMELIAHENFPIKALGLVHVRNAIEQLRPLNSQMTLDARAWVEGQREVDAGTEFDIHTEFSSRGEVVWRSTSTNLRRGASSGGSEKKKPRSAPEPLGEHLHIENWKIPADMGRRYAAVSGDNNPIHLYPLTAKALGFKRQIVHGMWTKARTAAALERYQPDDGCRLAVQFKLPVFLPGKVQLQALNTNDKTIFEVRDGQGVKPHMAGEMTAL